jgi:hypothetical protein
MNAELQRDPLELTLTQLRLDCGKLHVTGMVREGEDERSGALLLGLERLRLGLRLGRAGSMLVWGADREWLREQQDQIESRPLQGGLLIRPSPRTRYL